MSDQKPALPKSLPVRCENVKVGDLMTFTYVTKVVAVENYGALLTVQGITEGTPDKFQVVGNTLVTHALSADQFHETEKVSQTELARTLIRSGGRIVTVCFIKKDGEERTMRCHFLSQEDIMGRSYVIDLDMSKEERASKSGGIKQVDHRSIQWIVFDGVKYILK